jgi:hypothetical protein
MENCFYDPMFMDYELKFKQSLEFTSILLNEKDVGIKKNEVNRKEN